MHFEPFVPFSLNWQKLFGESFMLKPFGDDRAGQSLSGTELWDRLAGENAPEWSLSVFGDLSIGAEAFFLEGSGQSSSVMLGLLRVVADLRERTPAARPPILQTALWVLPTEDDELWFFLCTENCVQTITIRTKFLASGSVGDFFGRIDDEKVKAVQKAWAVARYRRFFCEHPDGDYWAALLTHQELRRGPADVKTLRMLKSPDAQAALLEIEQHLDPATCLMMALPENCLGVLRAASADRFHKASESRSKQEIGELAALISILAGRTAWLVGLVLVLVALLVLQHF